MKQADYLNYTAQELLQDDFFIFSQLYPSEESIRFWDELKSREERFAHEMDIAINRLRSVPFRNKEITPQAKNDLLNRIQETIRSDKKKKHRFRPIYKISVAACIAAICFAGWFYTTQYHGEDLIAGIETIEKPMHTITDIQIIDSNNNELTIDGEDPVIMLDKEGNLSVNSKQIETDHRKKEKEQKSIRYIQLITPSAKRSSLILSDGTRVWVNANSRVVYPDLFDEDKREILIEGEAYLEVAKDSERTFHVKTRGLSIEVLGTCFNVSAYEDNADISVVLVSGKVDVKTKDKLHKTLSPNEMLSLKDGVAETKTVNVNNYISWRKGTYTFEREKFSIVLNKLSCYYGEKITWNPEVEKLYCSGSLNLTDNFEQIQKGLERAVPILFVKKQDRYEVHVKP